VAPDGQACARCRGMKQGLKTGARFSACEVSRHAASASTMTRALLNADAPRFRHRAFALLPASADRGTSDGATAARTAPPKTPCMVRRRLRLLLRLFATASNVLLSISRLQSSSFVRCVALPGLALGAGSRAPTAVDLHPALGEPPPPRATHRVRARIGHRSSNRWFSCDGGSAHFTGLVALEQGQPERARADHQAALTLGWETGFAHGRRSPDLRRDAGSTSWVRGNRRRTLVQGSGSAGRGARRRRCAHQPMLPAGGPHSPLGRSRGRAPTCPFGARVSLAAHEVEGAWLHRQ
jgi:hypothetical protein